MQSNNFQVLANFEALVLQLPQCVRELFPARGFSESLAPEKLHHVITRQTCQLWVPTLLPQIPLARLSRGSVSQIGNGSRLALLCHSMEAFSS